MTDTASEIFGKEKPWVTSDVLDLCHERRDSKKGRYAEEGSREYREANKRVKKALKKARGLDRYSVQGDWCLPQQTTTR